MDLKTSFAILGLDPNTDATQAKHAYKEQVRRWHPDQFSADLASKASAEERLKRINIAYARVKAYLAIRQTDPGVSDHDAPHQPRRDPLHRREHAGKPSSKHRWLDHLFEALNTFARQDKGNPSAPPSAENDTKRLKAFKQVLDEVTGGNIAANAMRRSGHCATTVSRSAGSYHRRRHKGGAIGAVGGTEAPGPVKPVGRVRGIGKSR